MSLKYSFLNTPKQQYFMLLTSTCSSLYQVMQHEKARPGMESHIQGALTVALPQKIKRLSNDNFLKKIKRFGMGLLKMAGVATTIAATFM